ncbi:MAG: LytR/AlgR family response regulator transcription factor [Anaeroplasmataceae bacterium]
MDVIILDDNENNLEQLSNKISNLYPDFSLITTKDYNFVLSYVKHKQIVIVFLDIFMPKKSGIELSKEIYALNKNIPIVLFSGYPRETFDVYEGKHCYFLEKPFSDEKLKKALNIALEHLKGAYFTYTFAKMIFRVPINTICYFESNARLIQIHTQYDTQAFYGKLDEIEAELSMQFLRVNKSFLVNKDRIVKTSNTVITIKLNAGQNIDINISKKYEKNVLDYVPSIKSN